MSGEAGLPPSPPTSPSVEVAPASSDTPPKWFLDYQAKVDGRLSEIGKDFGRVRDKLPKDSEPKPAPDARAEMLAAMSIGELRSKLPAKAQAKLQSRIEAGESFATVREWAEDLIDNLSEQQSGVGATPKPPVPTGTAASAASSIRSPIRNRKELMALAKSNPAEYNAWMDQNDYHKLPR